MKVRRLNRKREKNKAEMAAVNKKLKCVILQQVHVLSLLLIQMLAVIENYQYSRMRILHMIGVYYIPWNSMELLNSCKHFMRLVSLSSVHSSL